MAKRISFWFVIGLMAVVLAGPSWAPNGLPRKVNFQGRFPDATSGTRAVVFKVYEVSSGGTAVWEQQSGVSLDGNGIFNTVLNFDTGYTAGNSFDTVFMATGDRYVAVEYPSGTEIVRQQLLSVPYAFRAEAAVSMPPIYVSGSNVGIGTQAPQRKLQVTAGTAGDVAYFQGASSGTLGQGLFIKAGKTLGGGDEAALASISSSGDNAGPLALGTGNTEVLRITTAGNVGIGTMFPASKLQINSSTADTSNAMIRQNIAYDTNEHRFLTISRRRGQLALMGSADWTMGVRPGTEPSLDIYRVGRPSSGVAEWLDTTNYSNLTLAWNGNVGIGTINPTAKLEVAGNASNAAEYNPAIIQFTDTSSAKKWQISHRGAADSANKNKLMFFYTPDGSNWIRPLVIDTAGRVGMGGVTNPISGQLQVQTAGGGPAAAIFAQSTADNVYAGWFTSTSSTPLGLRVVGRTTLAGSVFFSIRSVYSGSYNVQNSDYTIIGKSQGGVINIYLPPAGVNGGRVLVIKNMADVDTSGNIIPASNVNIWPATGGRIEGKKTDEALILGRGSYVTLQSDGFVWFRW